MNNEEADRINEAIKKCEEIALIHECAAKCISVISNDNLNKVSADVIRQVLEAALASLGRPIPEKPMPRIDKESFNPFKSDISLY